MMVVVVKAAVVMVAVVNRCNLINFIYGGSICGVHSGGGVTIGFGGSSLTHNNHHHHHQKQHHKHHQHHNHLHLHHHFNHQLYQT